MPATLQGTSRAPSASVHFSNVPSVHDRACFCVPGPQSGLSPVALQDPTFAQLLNLLGAENTQKIVL